jgi:hypothetical protein
MKYVLLLALLIGNTCFASGLDELRTLLSTLKGQGTLRGTFEARHHRSENGKGKAPEAASVAALVEQDANGLQVRWERALLKRAGDESQPPHGGKRSEALSTLIGASSALRIEDSVSFAPAMLRMLEDGQLKSERTDTWQGKPARLLELTLVEPNPDEEQVKMKENSHSAQIWLAADGTPFAASVTHRRKASVMVFLTFEQVAKEDFVFSVVANRLVVLKREEQGTAKGLGSDSQYRNSATFAPRL